MAEQLKLMYNEELILKLANSLNEVDPSITTNQFISAIFNDDWGDKELKARTLHIAETCNAFLPYDYPKQIEILSKIAADFNGFTGTIFPTFVELYGLKDEATSLNALAFFTQFSTSEFAIRPFLIQSPELIGQLYDWSKSKNYHIRRLASEGCRPLLPWAMKLQQYVQDPNPIIPILENLRNDPEDYVYRSVANNLNDISKNHPELVLDLCEAWYPESKTTKWVCKHALRTLLKKGNLRAMRLFGFGSINAISVEKFQMKTTRIEIGKQTELQVAVKNDGKKAKFRLEYVIGYLKKNDKHNEKVFQLRESELMQGEQLAFAKKLDFKNLSTRKHYPGTHYIRLKVNGEPLEKIHFALHD